jgi:hypothetical protein
LLGLIELTPAPLPKEGTYEDYNEGFKFPRPDLAYIGGSLLHPGTLDDYPNSD